MRRKILCMLVAFFAYGLLSSVGLAEQPKTYKLTYTCKDGQGFVTMIQKYHVLDGKKMRCETQTSTGDVIISIFRKDKKVIWVLYPQEKQYMEQPYEGWIWELAQNGAVEVMKQTARKTGKKRFMNIECDFYRGQDGELQSIYLFDPGRELILLIQNVKDNKVVSQIEATELSMDRPEGALFEIPSGYKKVKE